jgi:RNA recognition motif. (a.k.a. RRM, RBD, or RNP domain)
MSALQRTASFCPESNLPFDPEALKAGDMSQLENWSNGQDPSIYIKWIPDELLEQDVHRIFSRYGPISRIEFVPKMKNGQKIGRMLFIHFDLFTDSDFANEVAAKHPNPVPVDFYATNRNGIMRKYDLNCCVNMRPIPKVEYTASQLTDMFERLNVRVTSTMDAMKAEIENLKAENQFLRTELNTHKAMISMLPLKIENLEIITAQPAQYEHFNK